MKPRLKILLIEDDADDVTLIQETLKSDHRYSFTLESCATLKSALERIQKGGVDVVLLDMNLPDSRGLDTFSRVASVASALPVVVMSSLSDESLALESIRRGAQDYLVKDKINTAMLARVIFYAVERKRFEEELLKREERFRTLVSNIPGAIYRIKNKPHHDLEFISDTIQEITGYPASDFVHQKTRSYTNLLAPEDAQARQQAIENALAKETSFSIEYCLPHADGSIHWVQENGQGLKSKQGPEEWVDGALFDVTERKNSRDQINYLAYYDALTGLPNRILFIDRLNQALTQARCSNHLVGIVSLDLNNFKRINDTLGHGTGDELLKIVARRIIKNTAETSTVTRIGGDGFSILLPSIPNSHKAMELANAVSLSFKEPFNLNNHEIVMGVSMGISVYPDDGEDAETLVKNADTAMHRAKGSSRNSYQLYSSSMNSKAVERLDLESGLRHALGQRELDVHYQALVDVRSQKVIGSEALARWRHPQLGAVSPSEFIPLAEETGLIIPISEWIFETALTQTRAWQDEGAKDLAISINISHHHLEDPDFAQKMQALLKKTGLEARHVQLELTERMLMRQPAIISRTLRGLKSLGLKIAIDDFGTGYSSLSHLRRFPIDIIKIDRLFVKQLTEKMGDAAIVTAIIAMSHSLSLEVIAEGVETPEQLEVLRNYNCDQVQGYLLNKPMNAKDFTVYLRKNTDAAANPVSGG